MKVAFANRKDCLINRGGDTTQMLKTKKWLEDKYSVDIHLCLSPDEITKEYDLVHIFNIQTYRESFEYLKKAKSLGIKVIISTIYWDLTPSRIVSLHYRYLGTGKYLNNYLINQLFKLYLKLSKFRKLNKEQIRKTQYLLRMCDYLLPNSDEELYQVCKAFNIQKEQLLYKYHSVPNAIENLPNINNDKTLDIKDYVLIVGRIETIKNQISVVKALMDYPDIPIVIVGRVEPEYKEYYYNELQKYSNIRGNVYFYQEVSHDDVINFYKNAKVHVLASFRESPGLVSLEALQCGCEIVVSDERYCPTQYYQFDEYAHICNPFDINSIKEAILNAFSKKLNHADKSYFDFYSYENAADLTYEGYLKVLDSSK